MVERGSLEREKRVPFPVVPLRRHRTPAKLGCSVRYYYHTEKHGPRRASARLGIALLQGTVRFAAKGHLMAKPPGRFDVRNDAQTDVLLGMPKSAICVQRFDDSLNSAIHITYRSLLRSSSIHEPRDPPFKVVRF